MKRFVTSFIVFILPFLVLGIVAELLLQKIPNDYRYKSQYLDKHAKDLQVLVVGSSHAAYGIDPAYFHLRGFNACYGSQTYDLDMAILKKYDAHLDNLKYIIVPVDYPSLYSRLQDGIEGWRIKNYEIYYGLNPNNNFLPTYEMLTTKTALNLYRIYIYYVGHVANLTCSPLGWGTDYNATDHTEMIISGRAAAKRHTVTDTKYLSSSTQLLKDMVALAAAHHARVIFVTMPAYNSYTKYLDPRQLNEMVNTVNSIVANAPNALYCNMLIDSSFTIDDFHDADHMNRTGAEKMSKKLDSIITADSKQN